MYTLKVQSHFNAAHNLRGYRGKCERLHGHNWKVEARLSSERLNKIGLVYDFKELKTDLEKALEKLDHSYLNKLPYFKKYNPTSERIAEFLYFKLKKLTQGKGLLLKEVSVWETETSQASFSEEEF